MSRRTRSPDLTTSACCQLDYSSDLAKRKTWKNRGACADPYFWIAFAGGVMPAGIARVSRRVPRTRDLTHVLLPFAVHSS